MAEGSESSREDRTQPASPRRLQKAREQGNVARSRDLGHALTLGVVLAGCTAAGPWVFDAGLRIVRGGLRFSRETVYEPQRAIELSGLLGAQALGVIAPIAALLALAGVIASIALSGVAISTEPLQPKLSRLNPLAGLQRIASRDGMIASAKLVALSAALLGTGYWFASDRLPRLGSMAAMPLAAALGTTTDTLRDGLAWLVGLLVLAAAVDVPLQWFRYHAGLRMTPEEVKQEHKESDGDPQIKARIRAKQREISRSRMLAAVPTADVVVTNPTHYAVALRYDEARMSAPRVVAKGADHLAATIREAARAAGVPLLEAPPLARALYTHAELDRDIPVALYTAVAQVLAYVWQLRHFVPGRGPMPQAPESVEVPEGLDPNAASGDTDGAAR